MTNTDFATGSPDLQWIPDTCTLPTVDRPLRVAAIDQFVIDSVLSIDQVDPTTLRLIIDGAAIDRARDLAAQETVCCTFFDFTMTPLADGTATMQVSAPAAQLPVLEALAARMSAIVDRGSR